MKNRLRRDGLHSQLEFIGRVHLAMDAVEQHVVVGFYYNCILPKRLLPEVDDLEALMDRIMESYAEPDSDDLRDWWEVS